MPRFPAYVTLRQDLANLARKLPQGGRLEFEAHPDHLWLHILELPAHCRGGKGSEVLSQIIEAADKAQLPINLTADPTDNPSDPDTYDLVRWYSKFGFKLFAMNAECVALMERAPRTPRRAAEILKEAKMQRFDMTREQFDAWAEQQYALLEPHERASPSFSP